MDNFDNNVNNQYQQPYNAQPYQPGTNMPAQQQKDSKAIASLVLGIVSCLCCNPLFACSIIGIIMGIQSRKANPYNNTMATIGIVLSAIGIVFQIIAIIVGIVSLVTGAAASSSYTYHSSYY